MIVLWSIILAILHGLTLFLPISSSGIVVLFANIFKVDVKGGLLLPIFFYIGSCVVIAILHKKVIHLFLKGTVGILKDGIKFIGQLASPEESRNIQSVIGTQSRKFTAMIWLSMIPTIIIGFAAQSIAFNSMSNTAIVGIGFFISGVFLLVAIFVKGGESTPAELTYPTALIIGIVMGISSVPGISSLACVYIICLILGMNRKTAYEYTLLMMFLSSAVAIFREIGSGLFRELNILSVFAYLLGVLISIILSMVAYKYCKRLMLSKSPLIFVLLSIILGVTGLVYQFTLG